MKIKTLLMYSLLLASLTLIATTAKANDQHTPNPTTTAETVAASEVATATQSETPGESETENKLETEAEKLESEDLEKLVGYDGKNREVILERVVDSEQVVFEVYKTATVNHSYKQFLESEKDKALDYFKFLTGCSQN